MNRIRRTFVIVLSLIALDSLVYATSTGGSAAAFLKLGVGARALGMGDAYTAVSSGVDALYWNPSHLPMVEGSQVMFTYNPLIEGTKYNQAAFSYSKENQSFGIGYNGLTYDPIDSFDESGNRVGTYNAADQLFLVGYGGQKDLVSWGLNVKYLTSSIDNISAKTFMGDAALSIKNPWWDSFDHALVAKNIGGGLMYLTEKEPLPEAFVFGNSISFKHFIIGLDASKVKNTGLVGSVGLELRPFSGGGDFLSLRSGYNTSRNKQGGMSGASFGLGVRLGPLQFDYAWLPEGELGNSQAVTMTWKIPPLIRHDAPSVLRQKENSGSSVRESKGSQPKAIMVVITLRNNKVVTGELIEVLKDAYIVRVNSRLRTIEKEQIFKIEKKRN